MCWLLPAHKIYNTIKLKDSSTKNDWKHPSFTQSRFKLSFILWLVIFIMIYGGGCTISHYLQYKRCTKNSMPHTYTILVVYVCDVFKKRVLSTRPYIYTISLTHTLSALFPNVGYRRKRTVHYRKETRYKNMCMCTDHSLTLFFFPTHLLSVR